VTCSSCEARFERLLEGELSPRDRSEVLAHVDGCVACRETLEELRVVDALLLQPRRVELAANFTFATMAEARNLAPRRPRAAPLGAYLVSYVVGAWLLIGAAFVLAPQQMWVAAAAALGPARTISDALGGFAHVAARLAQRTDPDWGPLFAGGALVGDVALGLLIVAGLAVLRPRLVRRIR
jgi:anti-sigma factor RsiW